MLLQNINQEWAYRKNKLCLPTFDLLNLGVFYWKIIKVPTMKIAPSRSKSLKSLVLMPFFGKMPQNVAYHENIQT